MKGNDSRPGQDLQTNRFGLDERGSYTSVRWTFHSCYCVDEYLWCGRRSKNDYSGDMRKQFGGVASLLIASDYLVNVFIGFAITNHDFHFLLILFMGIGIRNWALGSLRLR